MSDKAYLFRRRRGKKTLADLFNGKSHLVVQHFMFAPNGTKLQELLVLGGRLSA